MEENTKTQPQDETQEQEQEQTQEQAQEQDKAQEQDPKEQKYSLDEVHRLLQSETDRRVNQALEKQRKEFEKKMSLSSLGEAERASAEKDMRITELEEQLREHAAFKQKADIMRALAQRGLDPAFADMIAPTGEQTPEQAAEALDKLVKAAVQSSVKARLSAGSPKLPADGKAQMTREEFRGLSLQRQAEIYRDNPDLYKKLTE